MGRPLNKKYFGNRNIGTGGNQVGGANSNSSNYADDRIGGEGIASISFSNRGSFLPVTSGQSPLAGLVLPAPTLPGGVQATVAWHYGVAAVTTGAGKTGLILNETYELAAIPGFVVQVTNISGANAIFTVVSAGDTTTLPTDLQTVSVTLRTGQGHTGVGTFTVDIYLKLVDAVIGEKGSGYTGAETFTVTLANSATGTAPAGTIVLTTDSGAAGTSTNQENAIIMYANVTGSGSTGVPVDIIRQVSGRRYKVTDGTYTGIVKLGTDSTPATGNAYLVATATGGTYYVTKLTAHKATLVAKTGDEALDGQAVRWRLSTPTASIVTIENA